MPPADPGALHTIALRFAYDGSRFPNGYARQPQCDTVEDALLAALQHEGYVDGSWRTGSRTDRGVSAVENVAACTLARPHLRGLLPAVQRHLPAGLWVTGAAPVPTDWNPRHAVRTYQYTAVANGEDPARLDDACAAFVGRQDMTAFARLEGRNPVREIQTFRVEADGSCWRFMVTSPGFLWNQVRRMVDAALRVGRSEADVADIEAALRTGRPHPSFKLAPAEGLLLGRVAYDPEPAWQVLTHRKAAKEYAAGLASAAVAARAAGINESVSSP